MTGAHAIVREMILRAGYDLPDGVELPPMDVGERAVAVLAASLSAVAWELGLETDPSITRSTVPPARSLARIRRTLIRLNLALAFTAVELGLDDPALDDIPDDVRDQFSALLRQPRIKPLDP